MLSEKKRQHLFFIEIPENNAKNSALQNVNYCVTNFLYTTARNQKSDVADEKQYKPDCSRQECQMAGGAFPLGGKFCSERRIAVINPDHQRNKSRHQVTALRLVVAEIRVVHVHEQRDQAGEEQHHKEEKLRLFAEPVRDHAKEQEQQETECHQGTVQQVKHHWEMDGHIGERADEAADGGEQPVGGASLRGL